MKLEEPRDCTTRQANHNQFTINDAKDATDRYTDLLWRAIEKRLPYTDLTNSPCAFSEAPAESIFSVFSRVTQGRECMSILHATALARVAIHGPPVARDLQRFQRQPYKITLQSLAKDFVHESGTLVALQVHSAT